MAARARAGGSLAPRLDLMIVPLSKPAAGLGDTR